MVDLAEIGLVYYVHRFSLNFLNLLRIPLPPLGRYN